MIALALCGILHLVGSVGDSSLVLETATERVTLVGKRADELPRWNWPRLCVRGRRTTAATFGTAYVLDVEQARPVGDGRRAPIVGTVEHTAKAYVLHTDDGKRFRLGGSFEAIAGQRVLAEARWQTDRLIVSRWQLISEAP